MPQQISDDDGSKVEKTTVRMRELDTVQKPPVDSPVQGDSDNDDGATERTCKVCTIM